MPRRSFTRFVAANLKARTIVASDPDTGLPLTGNQIPPSLLDPVAAKLAALLPTVANLGDRFVWAYADPLRSNEMLAKIDHWFNSKHQIQASIFHTWGKQQYAATAGGGNAPAFGPQVNTTSQNTASFRHTWVATPSFIVQSRYALAQHNADRENSQLGRNLSTFGAVWPDSGAGARKYLPQLSVSDGFSTSAPCPTGNFSAKPNTLSGS